MLELLNDSLLREDLERVCNNCNRELSELSNQNLLITGAAGFLGYYFAAVIAYWNKHNENRINCVLQDNFKRGRPNWIDKITDMPSIRVEERDVLQKFEDDFDFQNIIHAASIASPIVYRKFPIETMDANVVGLRNLLDAQLLYRDYTGNPTRFLYFSTSEIYGDPAPEFIPTPESYRGNVSCTGPRACYDESKRYGETMCVNFAREKLMHITIARPFNNYGPGLNLKDGRAVSDFIYSIINHRKITLLSDGSPTRTFCYISDAITGYLKTLVVGTSGESYNIGNNKPEISMLDLAKTMKYIFEKDSSEKLVIDFQKSKDKNYLTDNPNRRCPDITKAISELGFCPQIDIESGLEKTFLWNKVF